MKAIMTAPVTFLLRRLRQHHTRRHALQVVAVAKEP